ncbi:hypothetical protein G7B40_001465 [Aetokthonos hydrillicola Thurmond2011]|jgi:hypothetical protein|uniref:Uncharacterized protein n=1 Tax=Aetokthonos hydrillicola Thurmond2011 TaxID=2712845 RepID=A0AAP5M8G8_9CYAN|nr:hypothetical protein [Aetokthonos hydrillicola]MBO3463133.1 hypothetical protein [Aetokthonos hydrillicola CCALA 1050]MBW4591083.1 hypothetical protein [Aetokthonos hydrillicola CCALA 1050]MDR9893254.1 hypothetical protein [Aetokthonos hydrillicola Thurmond2011]
MTTKTDFEKLALNAYQAYGKTTNFQDSMGDPVPTWKDLPTKIKQAWVVAVTQVVEDYIKSQVG